MIEAGILLIKIMLALSLTALAFGLVKPVYVLWFLDRFNRLRVIRIYGSISLFLLLVLILFQVLVP